MPEWRDLADADPQLGALALNVPGTTKTRLPAATSPAVDAVDPVLGFCTSTDQRGITRPQSIGCDVGAVELEDGLFSGVVPARILNTKVNLGHTGALGGNQSFNLHVLGEGGVPASGVSAVVMNVTAVSPSRPPCIAW